MRFFHLAAGVRQYFWLCMNFLFLFTVLDYCFLWHWVVSSHVYMPISTLPNTGRRLLSLGLSLHVALFSLVLCIVNCSCFVLPRLSPLPFQPSLARTPLPVPWKLSQCYELKKLLGSPFFVRFTFLSQTEVQFPENCCFMFCLVFVFFRWLGQSISMIPSQSQIAIKSWWFSLVFKILCFKKNIWYQCSRSRFYYFTWITVVASANCLLCLEFCPP